MATSQVRVAVRIRPLTPNEVGQGANQVVEAVPPTVGIGERRFTYDSVFDSHVTQSDLYGSVSGPLLKSFLEGYNATIMAYGQTGSGKTFTMGSEAHSDGEMSVHPGLIPRFMFDLFQNLEQNKTESDSGATGQVLLEYRVTASFLEVYGEDVHDLLDKDRKTLPLREDANGGVVVHGLTSRSVSNAGEALKVLHDGTMNRTTAATLMNLTSSRSHAVFTIGLQQTCRSSTVGDVDVTTTSCFTFVDLAGSERMKKTGAEGERAREGIKINEGLLALGNVINALADEERLVKEKKVHVPYRQSKLTRLLQDALGGNSQTLFLACVSPADSNASETLSTLHYANRARNIKNAPTKNIDATVVELQRLHALAHVLQCELVKNRFASNTKSQVELGEVDDNLLNQQDVKDYIETLRRVAEARQGSMVPVKLQGVCKSGMPSAVAPFGSMKTPMRERGIATPSKNVGAVSVSRLPLEKFDDVLLDEVNPEEEMAILDQLLELQHRDNEYDKEHRSGEKELKKVEGELEEQEAMLIQIRESLKVYHHMKDKYESLMGEVQQLESEKMDLAEQLEKANADPSKGCSNAIKKKLEKVESNLARARSETRKHQQMYRKAEHEAQKSKVLERKITELKHAKVSLMKKQKESAVRHREYTEAKKREIMALKRKERTAGQKVSKLEAEINIHKNNLEKRKDYCDKLNGKLKQTEAHLMKLLAMRKRELSHRTSMPTPGRRRQNHAPRTNATNQTPVSVTFAPPSNETKSILFLLDKAVAAEVSKSQTKRRYEERVAEYSDIMRDMIAEVHLLSEARTRSQESNDSDFADEVQSREQNVEDLELKLELVGSELECLKVNLPVVDESSSEDGEESVSILENNASIINMLGSVDAPTLRTVFREMISKLVGSEVERQRLEDTLQRKESTLQSFNDEVDTLNSKINMLTKEVSQRLALSEASNENFELIDRLTKEKTALDETLKKAQRRAAEMDKELSDLRSLANKSSLEKNEIKEKLIIAEAFARQHSEESPVGGVLDNLQAVWKDLGVTDSDREDAQRKIESSLDDTCNRIIDEALALKARTADEVDHLRKELMSMSSVLGKDPRKAIDEGIESDALLPLCHSLREKTNMVRPEFKSAVERRAKLANDARALLCAIGDGKGQPSSQLMEMIHLHSKFGRTNDEGNITLSGKAQRAAVLRNVQGMVASLDRMIGTETASDFDDHEMASYAATSSMDEFDLGPPRSLHVSVLDSCEKEVSRLRLLKSELLVRNSDLRKETATLVKEMLLSADEVVSLTQQVIQLQSEDDTRWWVTNVAQETAKAILDKERPILSSEPFSKHLEHIHNSMDTVAKRRRLLSHALKGAVDRAQKTLLMTVDGEADVSEAYASFHDALFHLPPLSKEHVEACITEMNALVAGVEAMIQSEVEALTVVWEALDIKTSQRSQFWSHLEQETTGMQSNDVNPFEEVKNIDSGYQEEWVVMAVKDANKVYKELSMRLFKLEQIHQEVETLRSKQDIKSRIITLDSEIRILSAKLADFEDKKCSKNRLLTKKTGSGSLLKEERFRKQMQGKFTSKLEQLAGLLRTWIETEGDSFDVNMLSDEVRRLLENSDHMDSWVEKRTEFMHLNLNSKLAGKRPHNETSSARSGSNESRSKGASPFEGRPTKMARTGRSTKPAHSPPYTRTTETSRSTVNKRKPEGRSTSPTKPKMRRTGRDQTVETNLLSPSHRQPDVQRGSSSKVGKRSTRSSISPFGHLLSEALSPHDKENAM